MAALSVLGCSQHRVLLVRIFLFLAVLHYTSSALTADEYSIISSPSSSISVISFKSLTLRRVRRSINTDTTPSSSTVQSLLSNTSSSQTTKSISSSQPLLTIKDTTVKLAPTTATISTAKSVPISTATSSLSLSTATTLPSTAVTNDKVTDTSTKQSTHSVTAKSTSAPPTPTTTNTPTTTTPGLTTPLMKVVEDNHRYYKSLIIQEELNKHWINMDDGPFSNHRVLSNNHRVAAPVKINFKFKFFGHTVVNLTIATGGFLYMSPFLHKWLTATQYIAPLMANFDTSIGKGSEIRILDTENMFVVHWKNVHLHDQKSSKGIVRIIYEYHRVTIDKAKIRQRTVVILTPLPTCNLAEDCQTCFTQKSNFSCRWCSTLQRCSNGIDWHRQSWIANNCNSVEIMKRKVKCPMKPIPVAAIIAVVIVLILCIALGAWCYYGYSHPTSQLGMWLMENRPSQVKAKMANMKFWKQSTPAGDKYRIESNA
ncbi:Hypothetical predicted protein [Octopus vulgaris]|uniref:Plexin domain-containing protein 2 n=1 Tax=Octopus vulgaris TaxID=6645 RepID=A0AA36B4G3_OCTVU|nr:Hypothetical predicted protein [Octopus vulgaris]